ncbi:MAG: hypothetical protein BSOLF_0540 [Candidatus Carbobacillus altaicus]|uniref:Prepilin type IV endopeptidase peptidase domain-containing protein n=1 Tax=Candidatus Carbonibacillus altaicus TaxID=2163959 RepID=A0A2R6Y0R1_9BACL|nr:MAG: hypothetical protein BSOLF_0540 [Candidatus Carbobacillus altaicus]
MNELVLLPLAIAAWVDQKERIIPDWTWVVIIVLRALLGIHPEHIVWGGVIFLFLYLWFIFVPGMGGGDVKLLSAMALFLGNMTLPFFIMTFVLAFLYGLILYMKTKDKNVVIPLAVPAFIASIFVIQAM